MPNLGLGMSVSLGLVSLSMGLGQPLDDILGAGGDYAYYDFTKTDRQWQESNGLTPSSSNGNLIGLKSGSERQGNRSFADVMAAQPELITNGDFSNGVVGWSPQYSAQIAPEAGQLKLTATQSGTQRFSQAFTATVGKTYLIRGKASRTSASGQLLLSLANNAPLNASVANSAPMTAATPTDGMAIGIANAVTMYAGGSNTSATIGLSDLFDDISVKEIPAHYAIQAVTSARPTLQAAGAKFDGSDDYLTTDWSTQPGANCIIAQVTVPETLSGQITLTGGQDGGSSDRLWISVDGNGRIRVGVGNNAPTLTTDIRGRESILALTVNADRSQYKVYLDGALEGSGAVVGPISSGTAKWFLGAFFNSSVNPATPYWPGAIRRIAFGKVDLSLAQFQQIRQQWLAS